MQPLLIDFLQTRRQRKTPLSSNGFLSRHTKPSFLLQHTVYSEYSESGGLSLVDNNISATMETLTLIPTQMKCMHKVCTETHEKDDMCVCNVTQPDVNSNAPALAIDSVGSR